MTDASRDTPPENADGLPAPSEGYDDVNTEVCAIIQQFDELPKIIRLAEISEIVERRVDRRLIDVMIDDTMIDRPRPDIARGRSSRRHERKASLLRYLGRRLTCVVIRLPSVQYTIEIDRKKGQVVHWEWRPL